MVPVGYPLPMARATMAELSRALQELRSVQQVEFGVYVEDLHSGLTVDVGGSGRYEVAGLEPFPVSLYVFHHAALGAQDLSALVEYLPQDRAGGPGVIQEAPFGRCYTLKELCYHAIVDRDRTALRMINRAIGEGVAETWLRDQRGLVTDGMTPSGYAAYYKLLLALADERPGYGGLLLRWVSQSTGALGVAKYLPASILVAHQIGSGAAGFGDVGVIFRPRAPYLISVMASLSPAHPVGPVSELVSRIGALINQHMSALDGMFASLFLNGKRMAMPIPACVMGDEVIAPLEGLTSGLCAQATVDQCANLVTVRCHGKSVELPLTSTYVFEQQRLVPVELVVRGLGIHMDWDVSRNRVLLLQ